MYNKLMLSEITYRLFSDSRALLVKTCSVDSQKSYYLTKIKNKFRSKHFYCIIYDKNVDRKKIDKIINKLRYFFSICSLNDVYSKSKET